MKRATGILITFSCIVLSACGSAPAPAPRIAAHALTPQQMLVEVRKAGEAGNEINVQPLRDESVEDLRDRARAAETANDIGRATDALAKALTLSPNDPDLLQWQAELALLSKAWLQAEMLAQRSYQAGPKLGGLCRRNWTTIRFSREARGDLANVAIAQQRLGSCTVAPPARL